MSEKYKDDIAAYTNLMNYSKKCKEGYRELKRFVKDLDTIKVKAKNKKVLVNFDEEKIETVFKKLKKNLESLEDECVKYNKECEKN